jgi:hypothetical protein
MSDERLEEEHLTPTPDTIDFSKVPREAQERFYESWRIQEWIGTTSKILNLRLQPGFAKFEEGLSLPSLSFDLANKYFQLMKPDKVFTRRYRPIIDGKRGERIVERVYFVFDTHLPSCPSSSPEYSLVLMVRA